MGRIKWVLFLVAVAFAGCSRSDNVASDSVAAAEIKYNVPLTFGDGGNAAPYKTTGWSKAEEKFTWSEGTAAELRLPVPATDAAVVLKMRIAALVKPPELSSQPVEIQVNGQKVAEWRVSDTADFTAPIPQELTKPGGILTILIKTPQATSPKTLGLSADPRVLGICCFHIELDKS